MIPITSHAAHVEPLPHSYILIIISRREMYRLSLPQWGKVPSGFAADGG